MPLWCGYRSTSRFWLGGLIMVGLGGACLETEIVEGFPDEFVGVGLELQMKRGFPVVVRPIGGGPADIAGVQSGDRITRVDGAPTEGDSLGDVVVKLRGKPDTQVTVEIDRGGKRILAVIRRQPLTRVSGERYRAEAEDERPPL